MKISTRGRYALRMMIDLAQHYDQGFIALKDISKRQDISKKYLEQIIPFLNRGNLLSATKGHMGGYRLAKAPSEITVREILESAEGSLVPVTAKVPVSCMGNTPNLCKKCEDCITLPIYEGLYDVVTKYFDSITLEDIINRQVSEFTYTI